jgi:geranylgeranyl transferase type-1 subunit beta
MSSFTAATEDIGGVESFEFHIDAHIKYFQSILNVMPSPYAALDTSRMTALYFSVVGLDILNALYLLDKNRIIEYIYSLQLNNQMSGISTAGFIGGDFTNHNLCGLCTAEGVNPSTVEKKSQNEICSSCPIPHGIHEEYHQGHIAMTYTALMSLATLGDDLSRVNKASIISGIH